MSQPAVSRVAGRDAATTGRSRARSELVVDADKHRAKAIANLSARNKALAALDKQLAELKVRASARVQARAHGRDGDYHVASLAEVGRHHIVSSGGDCRGDRRRARIGGDAVVHQTDDR